MLVRKKNQLAVFIPLDKGIYLSWHLFKKSSKLQSRHTLTPRHIKLDWSTTFYDEEILRVDWSPDMDLIEYAYDNLERKVTIRLLPAQRI